MSPGFAYTVATGRLFCPMDEFHKQAEELMGRPIFTHQFGDEKIWTEMRQKMEEDLIAGIKI